MCRMSPLDLNATLQSALAHHQSGQLDEAEAAYASILDADPQHLDALHLFASLRLQQGRPEDALVLSEQVIALAPGISDAHDNRGTALQALGRGEDAADAFRRAIDLNPKAAHHRYNLGNALRFIDEKSAAAEAYRAAIQRNPDLLQAYSNLGATLSELGLFETAIECCQKAIEINPNYADGHYNLGNAMREAGRHKEAIVSYANAIQHNHGFADAHCNMALTILALRDFDVARAAFINAQHPTPHKMAQFYQAVASEMAGESAEAAFGALTLNDPEINAWMDSWNYVKSHSDLNTELIDVSFDLLDHALGSAQSTGLVLEFGVRHGHSIRHIASRVNGEVFGFDSFTGLPTSWGHEPEGVYSTDGELPEVPTNVTLIPGWFDDTLGSFLDQHPGNIRFCNIDCDIYDSTVTVLDRLAPRIHSGTVLVFDEYIVNPTWRDDEFKAFQEAAKKYGWSYRYLAFGIITKQAAIIIQ